MKSCNRLVSAGVEGGRGGVFEHKRMGIAGAARPNSRLTKPGDLEVSCRGAVGREVGPSQFAVWRCAVQLAKFPPTTALWVGHPGRFNH